MVMEDICSVLKADPHTAEGLLPLFEERRKSRSSSKDDVEELKSACGAAIVSRLLMCILLAPAAAGGSSTTSTDVKKARHKSSDSENWQIPALPPTGGETSAVATTAAVNANSYATATNSNAANNSSIVDLATSLAKFLHDNCKRISPSTAEAVGTATPLTASDVVHYCTRLLSKSGIVTKLVFGEHAGGNGDEEIQEKLDQVVSLLNGIDQEIKLELALYKEFEEIWSWAALNEDQFFPSAYSSLPSLPSIDPERKELRGARECAWLLQCLLSLTSATNNHHNNTHLESIWKEDEYLFRKSLIYASISLLFEVMVYATDTKAVEEGPTSKRVKIAADDAEQDAIAALSMISNPTSPSPISAALIAQPVSQLDRIRKLFYNRMDIEVDLFRSSMNLITKFIEDQRGITKESLGTPKVLNILRCLYRDLRLDHVYHTGTTLLVVNHMELYHSSDIRTFLISKSDFVTNKQPLKVFLPESEHQKSVVEPRKESIANSTSSTSLPAVQSTTITSPQTLSFNKDSVSTSKNNASTWLLRLYTDPTLAKPSQILTQYFDESGGVALWQSITSILDRLLSRLLQSIHGVVLLTTSEMMAPHCRGLCGYKKPDCHHGANTAGINLIHHQVQTSVLALYYHSLQAILSTESKRLGSKVHTQLLSNPSFHRSLVAVGCQCVIFAASLSIETDIQFPAVLKIMEVDPIDFLRITECFVRALCSPPASSSNSALAIPFVLPCSIKNHLQECEEQILEKIMWESPTPSSVVSYNCIHDAIQALQHYSSDPTYGPLWPPFTVREEAKDKATKELIRVDVISKKMSKSLQNHYSSVSFIFRKLVTLSARRILDMSEFLNLDQYVTEQIWVTWKQLLADHVSLLYDRHLDQLIICTIYGVCKIARVEPELTFARIFESYYDLNPGKESLNEHIIRHILLAPDGQHGNVIHLYNQVFVPLAKQQLWKYKYYAREKKSQSNTIDLDDEVRLPFESSVYEAKCSFLPVRGSVHLPSQIRVDKTNVYVTSFSDPVSGDATEEPASIGPRVLYSFGDGSSYDVTLVNKTINYSRIIDNSAEYY